MRMKRTPWTRMMAAVVISWIAVGGGGGGSAIVRNKKGRRQKRQGRVRVLPLTSRHGPQGCPIHPKAINKLAPFLGRSTGSFVIGSADSATCPSGSGVVGSRIGSRIAIGYIKPMRMLRR